MHCRLALVVLLVGCGGRQVTHAPSAPPTAVALYAPPSNPVVRPLAAHSLWRGRYICAQGATALTLTLDLVGNGRATAVFDFGALPENPTVPSGRYLVVGSVLVRGDGTVDVALAPDRWIAQPPGYVMVGLVAAIDPGGRVLRGSIDAPGCTGVELFRGQ